MTNCEQSKKNFEVFKKLVPNAIDKACEEANNDSLSALDTLILIDSKIDEISNKIGEPLLLFNDEKEWANNIRKPFTKNAMIDIHNNIVDLAQRSSFPKEEIEEYISSLKDKGLDINNGLKRAFNEHANYALDLFDDVNDYCGKK